MKLPRLSIGTIMAGVILLAADFMIVRSILSRQVTSTLNLYVICILPMANVLAVVAFLIDGRWRQKPSWSGFAMSGLVAMFTSYWWLNPYCDALETAIRSSGLEDSFNSIPTVIAEFAILPALFLLPQVLIALAGGWLAYRFLGRPGTSSDPIPGSRRFATVSILIVLTVTTAIGLEGYLRGRVDPHHARLAPGAKVMVRGKTQSPFEETLVDGTRLALPERTRVKIVLDDFPSQFAAVQDPAKKEVQKLGDVRMVQVTLLEGEHAGQSAYVCRYRLQPD